MVVVRNSASPDKMCGLHSMGDHKNKDAFRIEEGFTYKKCLTWCSLHPMYQLISQKINPDKQRIN
jgi:hypothetical protein